MSSPLNESVQKSFAILDLLRGSRQEITAAVVVKEIGLNSVTANRFLRSLEHVGALVSSRKGTYRLGYALVDLGQSACDAGHVAPLLQPILDHLAANLQESSMATQFRDGQVVAIATADSARPLVVNIRVGSRFVAHATAHGKIWLSSLSDKDLDHYLIHTKMESLCRNTITDVGFLRQELEKIRQQGYAENISEHDDGICAIAVPIVSRTGKMITSISVFGPEQRFTQKFKKIALKELKQAATQAMNSLYGDIG